MVTAAKTPSFGKNTQEEEWKQKQQAALEPSELR